MCVLLHEKLYTHTHTHTHIHTHTHTLVSFHKCVRLLLCAWRAGGSTDEEVEGRAGEQKTGLWC